MYNDELICYYSDQRDPAHGQKLVHQVSSDLQNWGPVVTDEARSAMSGTVSLIDKMSAKGIIHDNAAARYKSRLAKRFAAAS